MTRRRYANRKLKEQHQPGNRLNDQAGLPDLEPVGKDICRETPALEKRAGENGCIPVALVLEMLAKEYVEGGPGEALGRVALRLAEESGLITSYRAKWDALQDDTSGSLPVYLFDRRQSLELIRYHQSKGNKEALLREKDKLEAIEGRMLLGQSSPLKITSEDLEKLEDFIKYSGF